VYQRWIESYHSEEFERGVTAILGLVDRVGAGLGSDDAARLRGVALAAARYEWMFWDAAWRRESWPLSLAGEQAA
jgi:thiaminase/transcriptional activator TenA